jgi:hypothetical protein
MRREPAWKLRWMVMSSENCWVRSTLDCSSVPDWIPFHPGAHAFDRTRNAFTDPFQLSRHLLPKKPRQARGGSQQDDHDRCHRPLLAKTGPRDQRTGARANDHGDQDGAKREQQHISQQPAQQKDRDNAARYRAVGGNTSQRQPGGRFPGRLHAGLRQCRPDVAVKSRMGSATVTLFPQLFRTTVPLRVHAVEAFHE